MKWHLMKLIWNPSNIPFLPLQLVPCKTIDMALDDTKQSKRRVKDIQFGSMQRCLVYRSARVSTKIVKTVQKLFFHALSQSSNEEPTYPACRKSISNNLIF